MKVIALILISIISSSCVIENYIISNLDFFIAKRTRSQLHIDYSYQGLLRKDIQDFLKSHQGVEQELIIELKKINFDSPNLSGINSLINEVYYNLSVDYSSILAKYLAMLTSEQKEKFFRDELKKNLEITEQVNKQDYNRYLRRYRFFLGELTQQQVKIIETKISMMKNRSQARLLRRQQFQKKLQIIFAKNLDKEQKQKQIYQAFLDFNSYLKQPEEIKIRTDIIKNIERVFQLATKEQKKNLESKRAKFISWLTSFAKQDFSS